VTELVSYARTGRIAEIRLRRPEKLNAINAELLDELIDAMYRLDSDEEAWMAILSGDGRSFCAGADFTSRIGSAEARGASRVAPLTKVFLSRWQHYKPVITAVQGHAFGGGLLLTLLSDLTVADETALFQVSEVVRGMDGTSLWASLQGRVTPATADRICLTGMTVDAAAAARWGLVHEVVAPDSHLEGARSLAEDMLRIPPLAVRTIVRERRARLETLETSVSLRSRERRLHETADFAESVAALREGRAPHYRAE